MTQGGECHALSRVGRRREYDCEMARNVGHSVRTHTPAAAAPVDGTLRYGERTSMTSRGDGWYYSGTTRQRIVKYSRRQSGHEDAVRDSERDGEGDGVDSGSGGHMRRE